MYITEAIIYLEAICSEKGLFLLKRNKGEIKCSLEDDWTLKKDSISDYYTLMHWSLRIWKKILQ